MHVFLFFVFLFFCSLVPFDRRCVSFSVNGWDMSNSTPRVQIRWHGVGGRTVERTLKFDTHVLHSFRPDIVIFQLGGNDLVTISTLHVGSALDEFVHYLHESCGVKLVCVCQTIRRDTAEAFNSKVDMLTRYLRVMLDPLPYAMF